MSCTMRPSSRILPFLANMSFTGVSFMTFMTAAESVVAAGIGQSDHLGFRGLRLQKEGGEIRGVERMPYAAEHFATGLQHHIGGVLFEILTEGVVGGQEVPAIKALLDGGETGHIGLAE